jgi:hemerythrin
MAMIEWDDSFSVGVEEINEQHKKLVSMINELYDAMKAGKGKDALGPIINGLIDYTQVHFKTEEDYFDKFGYPLTQAHKLEHKGFVDKVTAFKSDFDAGNTSLTIDVMNFLKDWLIHHIKGSDKKYTEFFHEHGVQ